VPVQISDLLAPEAVAEFPEGQRRAVQQGHRCSLAIPLLQEGEAVGAIVMRRLEAGRVQYQAGQPVADLRRPGRDRYRQCPIVR